jgi:hypothetical protein
MGVNTRQLLDMGRSNYQLDDDAMWLPGDVRMLLNVIYCAERGRDANGGWRHDEPTADLHPPSAHRQQ